MTSRLNANKRVESFLLKIAVVVGVSLFPAARPTSYVMANVPQAPNVETQRAAMAKLGFLAGEWAGEASAARGGGVVAEMKQTEVAQFKLDGLVLMIEGVGRNKSDGKLVLQALGLISFDDAAGKYRMRAFNDGRWLETDVTLAPDGRGLSGALTPGEIRTKAVLRINEKGEWTESHEITIGASPPRWLMGVTVRRV